MSVVDAAPVDGLASVRSGTAGQDAPDRQWVRVSCSGEFFGVALEQVREIMTPQPLTRLPGCDAQVAGLVGVRGRVVTVLDLGRILGMSASASLPDHRLLLVDHEERIIGLAVDDIKAVVAGVLTRSTQDSGFAELAQPFVTGAVKSADGGFRCLDVHAVIATCMA